jgi:hypothetical protein
VASKTQNAYGRGFESLNAPLTATRITPDDIAEIRGNYARLYMRESRSSFASIRPFCRNSFWMQYARTRAHIAREIADRVFWGPPLLPEAIYSYVYYSGVMESRTAKRFRSGTLRSTYGRQARQLKEWREVENAGNRRDQRYEAQLHAFIDVLKDVYSIEIFSRREKAEFLDKIDDLDLHILYAIINDDPLTEAQRSHIARRKKMAEASKHRICPDGTCKNNRCKAGGTVHEALTHYINGLSVDEATEVFRRGGYRAFYKTGGKYHFPLLDGDDEESAGNSFDELYARIRKEAVRKAKRYDKKEAAARIDGAFTEAFFTYLKPEPDYSPILPQVEVLQ